MEKSGYRYDTQLLIEGHDLVLEYCASLSEIFDIVVEDMDRQARGLKG